MSEEHEPETAAGPVPEPAAARAEQQVQPQVQPQVQQDVEQPAEQHGEQPAEQHVDQQGADGPEPVDAGGQLAGIDLPPLRQALEAVLMVVDEPVAEVTLAQVVERPTDEVRAALEGLAAEYDAQERGFELRRVAGGWRYYTRAVAAPVVERFVLDGQQARLTQAALETLAVVAYRQPVSRARVAAVRGVNVDGVMRTLVARGLVTEVGNDPGSGATLYGTTTYFLERLGVTSLDDLPDLAPFLPDAESVDELLDETMGRG